MMHTRLQSPLRSLTRRRDSGATAALLLGLALWWIGVRQAKGRSILLALPVAAIAGTDVTILSGSGAVLKPSQIDKMSIRKTCGD